jgi:translation initiation factor 3 subunit C
LKKPGAASSSESDSDDSDFDGSWSDDESGSDDEDGEEGKKKSKKSKKGKGKERKQNQPKAEEAKADTAPAAEEKKEEWTPAKIDNKVKELLAKRGTKNYDRLIQVQNFVYLIDKCHTVAGANAPERILRIMFNLVDAQFDANPNMASHMTITMWKSVFNNFVKIIEFLKANPSLVLSDREPELDAPSHHVRGPLLPQLERLDDEFIKSLQFLDSNTQEYVTRVRDEFAFLKLARLAQDLFASRGDLNGVTVMAARRLDHLYYKREREPVAPSETVVAPAAKEDTLAPKVEEAKPQTDVADEPLNIPNVPEDTPLQDVVDGLCRLIYKHGDDKLKRRAMLQQIYNFAVHDKFFEARDLLLLSHLQESISLADAGTQVLYNRALVQLGLAAFRKGRIVDCHNYLTEIVFSGKTKELLAQGISTRYNQEKTEEQQKREKSRQVPYPMHINLDLIECVYLISAMLLEVPNMAANPHDTRKKIISKQFRKVMDYADRQVFSGPPENSREHVIAASRSLAKGDWQRTLDMLLKLDIWRLIPKSDSVKAMLTRKIQEEGLRAYLLTYGQFYESVNLSELSAMFELPTAAVHSLISRLILSDELKASFDQPSGVIVFHKADPTRLQYLALQFAEKVCACTLTTNCDIKTNACLLRPTFSLSRVTPPKVSAADKETEPLMTTDVVNSKTDLDHRTAAHRTVDPVVLVAQRCMPSDKRVVCAHDLLSVRK